MSSTNEELPPPPKQRASPLDFRNTDLVSRLLAATPPYLYNMPLVPNSFFFSEMLRSFVQAKGEGANRGHPQFHHRRPRKRSWAQTRNEYYQKESQVLEKAEMPSPHWQKEKLQFDHQKQLEAQLEKIPKLNETEVKPEPEPPTPAKIEPQINQSPNHVFPSIPSSYTQENTSHSNMVLPPPPPMWYPPLYPTPYGIDPLHFFIDLRVSGHIYDRKNGKEASSSSASPNQTIVNEQESSQSETRSTLESRECFKQSRHCSAFTVPVPSSSKNVPMNLSSDRQEGKMKFDVKSMGFDKSKTNVNYIMSNITTIYKKLQEQTQEEQEERPEEGEKEETEEERRKRVKDLRALIGLELVVDYMNHAKPGQLPRIATPEESSTDLESAGSPALEVVAIGEEPVLDP